MSTTPHRNAGSSEELEDKNGYIKSAYDHLCKSHDGIDSFRTTLLHLLPVASAGGIFLLLNKDTLSASQAGEAGSAFAVSGLIWDLLQPIGVFGILVTLGFFFFEVYGIRKCHNIILAAKELEDQLGMSGPFTHRPREVLGSINEPCAAGIIYPAVMAAWAFFSLFTGSRGNLPGHNHT